MSQDAADSRESRHPFLSQRWTWASQQAISFLMQQAVENPDCLSLAAGLVDPVSLPVELVNTLANEILGDPVSAQQALQYGTTAGADLLRAELVEHFCRMEGCPSDDLGISPEQIVATTGSQQMLSLICEVLLDPGDICLVAAPTYFVFLGVLDGVGARTIPVATDDFGMVPEGLDKVLDQLEQSGERPRVRLLYLVSDFENPSGVCLPGERRQQIMERIKRRSQDNRIFVLEDSAYREMRYDGTPEPSLWSFDTDRNTVIVAHTFSKSFSPGLRVGYGILPRELVRPVCDRKGNEDFGSAHLNQQLVARALATGRYAQHVESLIASYRVKRDTMVKALDEFLGGVSGVDWLRPHGGLYVWLSMPDQVPTGFDSRLFQRCVHEHKVMYVPGELCYSGPVAQRPNHQMRLSFGVLNPRDLRESIRRLSRGIIEELASSSSS